MKKIIAISILVSSTAFAGGGGTGGATEVTQILNNMELLTQTATQAKYLENALKQAMLLSQNEILSRWPTYAKQIAQVERIYTNSQVMASVMNGQAAKLKAQYAGYDSNKIREAVRAWSSNTHDMAMSSFEMAGLKMQDFQSQQQTIQRLNALAGNAGGQMQALQAGNQIAGMLAEQLVNLNQIQTQSMQMQAAVTAQKNSADDAKRAAFEKMGMGGTTTGSSLIDYKSPRSLK